MKKIVLLQLVVTLLFYYSYGLSQNLAFASHDLEKADSIALSLNGRDINNLGNLAYELTKGLSTDTEKFRSIFRWVCENISNDYELYLLNSTKRAKLSRHEQKLQQWEAKLHQKVINKLIEDKSTVCTGYAYLLRSLSAIVGIEVVNINGYGRSIFSNLTPPGILNHTWNAVKLGGEWYLCDATWASGYLLKPEGEFVKDYSDVYFLSNPKDFLGNHYPQDVKWSLLDNVPNLEQWLTAPVMYKESYKHHIQPVLPKRLYNAVIIDSSLVFQFRSDYSSTSHFKVQINKGEFPISARWTEVAIHMDQATGHLFFNLNFPRKGKYTIHLFEDNSPLITWEVHVMKSAIIKKR